MARARAKLRLRGIKPSSSPLSGHLPYIFIFHNHNRFHTQSSTTYQYHNYNHIHLINNSTQAIRNHADLRKDLYVAMSLPLPLRAC